MDFVTSLRGQGRAIGLTYPEKAPLVTMMGPQQVEDVLSYASAKDILPLPTLTPIFSGLSEDEMALLPEGVKEKIRENETLNTTAVGEFRGRAEAELLSMYGAASAYALGQQNKFHFCKHHYFVYLCISNSFSISL